MVGVPGKSKGCKTCRQRKIACGQQRPTCLQCAKSGRVCGGYDRETTFILVQPCAKGKRIASVNNNRCDEGDVLSPSSPAHCPADIERSASSLTGSSGKERAMEDPFAVLEGSTALTMILKTSNRQALVHAFLSDCFPVAFKVPVYAKPWIFLLSELPMKVKALDTASVALAAAKVGRLHDDPDLVRESHRLYTKALRELQIALWSRSLMLEDETLAACMALSLYEIMECPNDGPQGYSSHCAGFISLIHARGLDLHVSGAGHQLFLGARLPGILYALERHSPNFLSDPVWLSGPWAHTSKSPIDRIRDCLVLAPAILQKTHYLSVLSLGQQIDLVKALIQQCWDIDEAMQLIYEDIRQANPGPLYWPTLSRRDNPTDVLTSEKLFPVAYQFPDWKVAGTLMLYWATLVMLWSGLCDLYAHIARIDPDLIDSDESFLSIDSVVHAKSAPEEWLPPLCHRRDYMSMVRNVCQSVEYCLEDTSMLGMLTLSPSLGIVIGMVRDRPKCRREVAWMRAALELVRGRGFRILQFTRP